MGVSERSATIAIPGEILDRIHALGEAAYPEEGAGFLLGTRDGGSHRVVEILSFPNVRDLSVRHHRYMISPEDTLRAEEDAERRGLEVIGVFHSHPDHPDQPSDVDREWAIPWFSYVITSVQQARAAESRSWHLSKDRSRFVEERIVRPDEDLRALSETYQVS